VARGLWLVPRILFLAITGYSVGNWFDGNLLNCYWPGLLAWGLRLLALLPVAFSQTGGIIS